MKFSSSVTQSVIECLQASKAASSAGASNEGAPPKPPQHPVPATGERAAVPQLLGRVLLVDDDATVRDFLAKLLRAAGYRVTCAADGEAGWEVLCADSFDVLVTDHSMPKLTGLNLIRRLRVGPLKVLPCILVSANIPWEEKDLLDLVRPGMALAKPFSFLELLTCVRSLLPANDSVPADASLHLLEPEKRPSLRSKAAWQAEARAEPSRRRLARAV